MDPSGDELNDSELNSFMETYEGITFLLVFCSRIYRSLPVLQ